MTLVTDAMDTLHKRLYTSGTINANGQNRFDSFTFSPPEEVNEASLLYLVVKSFGTATVPTWVDPAYCSLRLLRAGQIHYFRVLSRPIGVADNAITDWATDWHDPFDHILLRPADVISVSCQPTDADASPTADLAAYMAWDLH